LPASSRSRALSPAEQEPALLAEAPSEAEGAAEGDLACIAIAICFSRFSKKSAAAMASWYRVTQVMPEHIYLLVASV
jgi:hypothetical protein